jgi:hypothetical protein
MKMTNWLHCSLLLISHDEIDYSPKNNPKRKILQTIKKWQIISINKEVGDNQMHFFSSFLFFFFFLFHFSFLFRLNLRTQGISGLKGFTQSIANPIICPPSFI